MVVRLSGAQAACVAKESTLSIPRHETTKSEEEEEGSDFSCISNLDLFLFSENVVVNMHSVFYRRKSALCTTPHRLRNELCCFILIDYRVSVETVDLLLQ